MNQEIQKKQIFSSEIDPKNLKPFQLTNLTFSPNKTSQTNFKPFPKEDFQKQTMDSNKIFQLNQQFKIFSPFFQKETQKEDLSSKSPFVSIPNEENFPGIIPKNRDPKNQEEMINNRTNKTESESNFAYPNTFENEKSSELKNFYSNPFFSQKTINQSLPNVGKNLSISPLKPSMSYPSFEFQKLQYSQNFAQNYENQNQQKPPTYLENHPNESNLFRLKKSHSTNEVYSNNQSFQNQFPTNTQDPFHNPYLNYQQYSGDPNQEFNSNIPYSYSFSYSNLNQRFPFTNQDQMNHYNPSFYSNQRNENAKKFPQNRYSPVQYHLNYNFNHNNNQNYYPDPNIRQYSRSPDLIRSNHFQQSKNSNLNSLSNLKNQGIHNNLNLDFILGHILEFSLDKHGSNLVQQKVESANNLEHEKIFEEIKPHFFELIFHIFGNYVIQKFLNKATEIHINFFLDKMKGRINEISNHVYGCRVIQKMIEVSNQNQQERILVELRHSVKSCVHDQNGNHVIQKCVEFIPQNSIQFIIDEFEEEIIHFSKHAFGCRVVQRILSFCEGEKVDSIIQKLLNAVPEFVFDQFANYVIQHLLENGTVDQKTSIVQKIFGKVLEMSQHKYASNVIEKCIEYGTSSQLQHLFQEVISKEGSLEIMMKDQYANYVVQKFLDRLNEKDQKRLVTLLMPYYEELSKEPFGKHIAGKLKNLN
ncbi:mateRNAl protein pumilio [Anaeramoeba ignava]|uniref:MateRNAl protein pumilio n=1 Tax=Anaeramoeba ignava TaxID=1746090 RepID=A0A9Q0R5F6_ANAIG|nr:mateRNAl protein pumilio [Anaeramoeba ignava]